jgi:small ubiquitin-related modifier
VKAEPGGRVDGALINIKVTSQTAEDVFFRVKRSVKLRRLIDMYCGKLSLNPKVVKFVGPEGGFLRSEQRLDEIGLDDGDEISLVLDQKGGGVAPPVQASQICA